jgi:hypothetical protein
VDDVDNIILPNLTAGTYVMLHKTATGNWTSFLRISGDSVDNNGISLGDGEGVYSGKGYDPLYNSTSILMFKSIKADVGMSVTSDDTHIYLSSFGGSSLPPLATNIGGGYQGGVFAGNTVSSMMFKNVVPGTFVSITTNDSQIMIDSVDRKSTYLTFFPYVENSNVAAYAAIDMLSFSNSYLKSHPVIYNSTIRGFYLHSYEQQPTLISPNETSIFQIGVIDKGQASISSNFSAIATIFNLNTDEDNGTYIFRCVNNISIPLMAGNRLVIKSITPGAFHPDRTMTRYIMNVYLDT